MTKIRDTKLAQGASFRRKTMVVGSSTLLATAATGTALMLGQGVASANAPIVVDSLLDDGVGMTLSNAIALANSTPGQDEITFSVTGTITLGDNLRSITDAVHITGPGAANLTINGADQYRVFKFDQIDNTMGTSSVTGVTITQANGVSSNQNGPAILEWYSNADLLIEDVILSDNYNRRSGGAVALYGSSGIVTINRTVMSDNTSSIGRGGALYACEGSAPLTVNISNSTFTGNLANGDGGAIHVRGSGGDGSELFIADSDVSGNSSLRSGGALTVRSVNEFRLTRSTIDGNTASNAAGGLLSDGGTMTILDSTISNNRAVRSYGGGIYRLGAASIIQTTISGNSAYQAGAMNLVTIAGASFVLSTITDNHATKTEGPIPVHGVVVEGGELPETIVTKGSIIAGNGDLDIDGRGRALNVESVGSLLGTLGVLVEIIDEGGTRTGVTSSQLALGPLGENGGPTQTHSLSPGSIAIDAGPSSTMLPSFPGNEFDQRGVGYARVVAGVIDIGSFETQPAPTPNPDGEVTPKFTG